MRVRTHPGLHERDRGFTLIELLVVIIVVGILAAIAIPVFLNQRHKAVDASLKEDLHNAAIQVDTWVAEHPGEPFPNLQIVCGASCPSDAAGVAFPSVLLSGFKPTDGNAVVFFDSNVQDGSYCLFALGDNASKNTSMATALAWRTRTGGLVPDSSVNLNGLTATVCP